MIRIILIREFFSFFFLFLFFGGRARRWTGQQEEDIGGGRIEERHHVRNRSTNTYRQTLRTLVRDLAKPNPAQSR